MSAKKGISSRVATRIKELRKKLGMNQTSFAYSVGTVPSSISKWESGKNRPSPDVFVKIAKLASDEDKLFFLEQAGVPEAFFMGESMTPEMKRASMEVVAKALHKSNPENVTIDMYRLTSPLRNIPLIKDPHKLGTREAESAVNLETMLPLPTGWFPSDGIIHAIRFTNFISPLVEGDLIGLIDSSRRDPDRLLGCIVAVYTPDGAEPMKLRKDGSTYLLTPLRSNADVRVLRPSGVGSIIGKVLKWIGDPN